MKTYLKEFLIHIDVSNSGSEHTESAYERDIQQYLKHNEGFELEQMDQDFAYEYLGHLYKMGLSPSSVARKVSTLRSYFLFLQQNYGFTSNPFSHVQIKGQGRSLPNYLSYSEIDDLLNASPQGNRGTHHYVLIELMYASGLRVSELVNLKLKDIDLEERSLRIIGKGDKQRVLFFYEQLSIRLKHYIKNIRPHLLLGKKHDTLFVNHYGDPITASSVTYLLDVQGKAAGIRQKVHPHILRHSFATHLLDNGASIRVVQSLLGHESLSTTQIYTHVSLKKMKAVYETAMENVILT